MVDPAHWDNRYATSGVHRVSWYQETPTASLELLRAVAVGPDASVIDVGGGASTLVDHLLLVGHSDVTVVDLSAVALDVARTRLDNPDAVTWIVHDLLTWEPPRQFDAWHDRAVLHFLTDDDERAAYVALLRRALKPGGAFVIGTFAEDGPEQCSALPVRRHTAKDLAAVLGDVEIVEQRREVHRTPGDAEQPFNWIAGRLCKASGVAR